MDRETFQFIVSLDTVSSDFEKDIIGKYGIWLLKLFYYGSDVTINRIHLNYKLISEYIEFYNKHLSKFDVKDIFQYKNIEFFLYDVENVINNTKYKVDSKDYTKFYEDGEWLIIIPHTEEASNKYGSNTRWCTAAKNNNKFKDYNPKESGWPLYYRINKITGKKYSFHAGDGFRNQIDDSINYIPGLPKKITIKYFKLRLINGPGFKQYEVLSLPEDLKFLYLHIKLKFMHLDKYDVELIPDHLKINFIKIIISQKTELPRGLYDYAPFHLKMRYVEMCISNDLWLYNNELSIAPLDLKIKYIQNMKSAGNHYKQYLTLLPDEINNKLKL